MKNILLITFLLVFSYSNAQQTGTFTDSRDNKTYKTVKIGSQTWMAENLAYKTENGCWAYKNDENNVSKYGYLYNWETAKNVCPSGWHLPTKKEFEILLKKYGGKNIKTNYIALIKGGSSNFSVESGGWRRDYGGFSLNQVATYFWTENTANNSYYAWRLYVHTDVKNAGITYGSKTLGFSVRCIKN